MRKPKIAETDLSLADLVPDPHLRIYFVRDVPRKARHLKHLTVRLVGRYDIGWTDSTPYESGVCLERTVSLLSPGEEIHLERGEHVFEVSRGAVQSEPAIWDSTPY